MKNLSETETAWWAYVAVVVGGMILLVWNIIRIIAYIISKPGKIFLLAAKPIRAVRQFLLQKNPTKVESLFAQNVQTGFCYMAFFNFYTIKLGSKAKKCQTGTDSFFSTLIGLISL